MRSDGLFVHLEYRVVYESIDYMSLVGSGGQRVDSVRSACFLSPLWLPSFSLYSYSDKLSWSCPDVQLKCHRFSSSTLLGSSSWTWLHIDKFLMYFWSCRGRFRLLSSWPRRPTSLPTLYPVLVPNDCSLCPRLFFCPDVNFYVLLQTSAHVVPFRFFFCPEAFFFVQGPLPGIARLHLPLPLLSSSCRCGCLLDVRGHHCTRCSTSTVLGRRGDTQIRCRSRLSSNKRTCQNQRLRDMHLLPHEIPKASMIPIPPSFHPLALMAASR